MDDATEEAPSFTSLDFAIASAIMENLAETTIIVTEREVSSSCKDHKMYIVSNTRCP